MKPEQHHIYSRHLLLDEIGAVGQQKLLDATAVIIGVGGLGCPVATYLAACGVGNLHLIDGDTVEASNLHRQVLFGMAHVGANKAVCAVETLRERYPHQHFIASSEHLTSDNALQFLEKATIVIDCTDNFQARYLINDACVQLKLPFVYGALHKFEGQVAVFNVEGGPTYRCVFPELPKAANQPNCSDVGVLGVLPGIIGTMQALEAIKYIVGISGLLSDKLLTYNALNTEIQHIRLPKRNAANCDRIASAPLRSIDVPKCDTVVEVSWKTVAETSAFTQIVDLRDAHELPESPRCTTHRISAHNLPTELDRLDPEVPVALFCQSGQRSRTWAEKLTTEYQFTHVVSIAGGMNEHTKQTRHEELL